MSISVCELVTPETVIDVRPELVTPVTDDDVRPELITAANVGPELVSPVTAANARPELDTLLGLCRTNSRLLFLKGSSENSKVYSILGQFDSRHTDFS